MSKAKELYNGASQSDREVGSDWYRLARLECHRISVETGKSFGIVCAVVALLSPSNKWQRNLADAYELCNGNFGHKCCTYGTNKRKAISMLTGDALYSDVFNFKTSPKVTRFFKLLRSDTDDVCVDTWMFRAFDTDDREEIERDIVQFAQEINVKPHVVQATIWCSVRGKQW